MTGEEEMIWKLQTSCLEGIRSSIISIYYKHETFITKMIYYKDEHYQLVYKPKQTALLFLPHEPILPILQHSAETSFIDYSSIQWSLALLWIHSILSTFLIGLFFIPFWAKFWTSDSQWPLPFIILLFLHVLWTLAF